MTIKKMTAMSIVASTLLAGSLSAAVLDGTLVPTGGATGKVANELFQVVTDTNVSISNYAFKVNIDGSGTVNTPTFKYSLIGGAEFASDPAGFVIVDINDSNASVTEPGKLVDGTLVFSANDANTTAYSGHEYEIRASGNLNTRTAFNVTVNQGNVTALGLQADLYSTSGTEDHRSTATMTPLYSLVDEYTLSCSNKFDNLINVENESKTFVTTRHGAEVTIGQSDMNSSVDTYRCAIVKTAVDYGLDGNGSKLMVFASNNANDVNLTNTIWSSDFGGSAATVTVNDTNVTLQDDNGTSGGFVGNGTSGTFNYLTTVDLNGTTAKPTTFNAEVWIGDTDLMNADANGSVKITTNGNTSFGIGEWTEFAYIAQIADVADVTGNIKTKIKLVNRGCDAKNVIFKVFDVTGAEATFNTSADATNSLKQIPANGYVTYLSADIKAAALENNPNLDLDGKAFTVEVIVSGNAEDVYGDAIVIYSDGARKTIPMYTTSTRSY